MGSNQIDLQLADLVRGDANIAQFPHTGRDRVSNFVGGDDFIDDSAGMVDQLSRIGREEHRAALMGDFAYCFQRQIVSVNVQCVQEIPVDCYFPAAARKTARYLPGKAATFMFESVTM